MWRYEVKGLEAMEERSSREVMIINTWDYPLLEKGEASIYDVQICSASCVCIRD